MDVRIQAAIIGALSALLGVLIGGYIQSLLKRREISHEKHVAEGAVALYLCQTRKLFLDFSDLASTHKNLALGVTANANNIAEIDKITEIIQRHDPFLTVKLFNIKQRLYNINVQSKTYWETTKDSISEKLDIIASYINIDAKGGLREVDECIKHAFNHSEKETRMYLLERADFIEFLKEILGEGLINKLRIKFKILGKI